MKCPLCSNTKVENFCIDESIVKKLSKVEPKNLEILLQMVTEAHTDLTMPKDTSRLLLELKSVIKEEVGESSSELMQKLAEIEKHVIIIKKQPYAKGKSFEELVKRILLPITDDIKPIGQEGTRATDILTNKGGIKILIEAKARSLPKSETDEKRGIVKKFIEALNEHNTQWGIIVTENMSQLPNKEEPVDIQYKENKVIVYTTTENGYLAVAYRFVYEMASLVKKNGVTITAAAINDIKAAVQDLIKLKDESHQFVELGIDLQERAKSFEQRFDEQLKILLEKMKILLKAEAKGA